MSQGVKKLTVRDCVEAHFRYLGFSERDITAAMGKVERSEDVSQRELSNHVEWCDGQKLQALYTVCEAIAKE